MDPKEIKKECVENYDKIKKCEVRLEELRLICKHENTYEGNYSWRPGAIQKAEICSYCNKLIKYL